MPPQQATSSAAASRVGAPARAAAAPRVQRRPQRVANSQRHLQARARGARACKQFEPNGKCHRGIIRDSGAEEGYCLAKHEDGDEEEYTLEELKELLHKPGRNNIERALAATRYERVELQYRQTDLSYNPELPLHSASKWRKAMAAIEYQELYEATDNVFQSYKHAFGVLDERQEEC